MNIEKLPKSRIKATFDISTDDFNQALDKAFETVNKKITIKGFRKGQAPRSVYEKNYGIESLFDEALNVVLNEKINEIYKDETFSAEVCGQFEPNIETEGKIEVGKPFVVSLSFDVYPEVELGLYKGLEVKKAELKATEKEIDLIISDLLKTKGVLQEKADMTISNGSTAKFDFDGSIDGVPFEGGSSKGYELEIGSKQFIPGFEDQMIGMKKGDEKVISVNFPEDYQAADLAGKPADFKVKLHEVKEHALPNLDDEFVKSLAIEGINTLEELKASKKVELEANKVKSEKDRQVDEMFNKIIDNAKVDMPDSLIKSRVEQIRGQYEQQAKMYNIPFDTFLGLMNITKEKFESDTYEQALRQAKFNIIISKLIEVENLSPTKEELDIKAEKEALVKNTTKDAILKDNLQAYYSDIAYQKVIDFLLSNAKII